MAPLPMLVTRLNLSDIDPAYEGLWIDVRNGLTTRGEMEMANALRIVAHYWRKAEAADEKMEMRPKQDQAYVDANATLLAQYALRTNITHDAEGNELPKRADGEPDVTTSAFWLQMPSDIRDAVSTHYRQKREAREARLSGEAFTGQSNGSSPAIPSTQASPT